MFDLVTKETFADSKESFGELCVQDGSCFNRYKWAHMRINLGDNKSIHVEHLCHSLHRQVTRNTSINVLNSSRSRVVGHDSSIIGFDKQINFLEHAGYRTACYNRTPDQNIWCRQVIE